MTITLTTKFADILITALTNDGISYSYEPFKSGEVNGKTITFDDDKINDVLIQLISQIFSHNLINKK